MGLQFYILGSFRYNELCLVSMLPCYSRTYHPCYYCSVNFKIKLAAYNIIMMNTLFTFATCVSFPINIITLRVFRVYRYPTYLLLMSTLADCYLSVKVRNQLKKSTLLLKNLFTQQRGSQRLSALQAGKLVIRDNSPLIACSPHTVHKLNGEFLMYADEMTYFHSVLLLLLCSCQVCVRGDQTLRYPFPSTARARAFHSFDNGT